MKLTHVHVTHYRSVRDSSEFTVDPDVTCLVGKNESGKTAVLQGLWRLNADDEDAGFDRTRDYPRAQLNKYSRLHPDGPAVAVKATLTLEPGDVAALEERFGAGVIESTTVVARRDYDNVLELLVDVDEGKHVQHLIRSEPIELDRLPQVRSAQTVAKLVAELQAALEAMEAEDDARVNLQNLLKIAQASAATPLADAVRAQVQDKLLPRFMYFGDYDIMKGAADLEKLKKKAPKDAGLRTLCALLKQAEIEPEDLAPGSVSYEDHKARLESTANSITDEVFEFWTQNSELEVEFDVAAANANDPGYEAPAQGQPAPNWLRVRVKNRRHRVSVPFDERSRGFVWFFSFLARFNQIADSDGRLILLLDEPGLSLHGSAQADFLRFINERLAARGYQVLYTTHSPFMVEPTRLHRVRTVEDSGDVGTVVSAESLRSEDATSFPLQAALGYSLAQTLFVGPNCLLVEGPSDLLFLQVMSDLAQRSGRDGLDERWVIVPVGGADRLATFATLLGANELNIAVLMDFEPKDTQRVEHLLRQRVLHKARIVTVAEHLEGSGPADIEDLLGPALYVSLVNGAFGLEPTITEADLPPGRRIAKRVASVFKTRGIDGYNHFRPASFATRGLTVEDVSSDVIDRFVAVFGRLNGFLSR